ncbi:FAD:protein FMN transferase [Runella sp.]|uniref:FAD:protein FMN transferase n=1 Tax=Runella sp. TaxID=1960881 RepID=UPI003D0B2153
MIKLRFKVSYPQITLQYLAIIGLLLLISSTSGKAQKRYAYFRNAMGSEFNLVFYAPNDSIAKIASDSVFKRIEFLTTILSDYLDGSETNRLSSTAGSGQSFPASKILFELLQQSLKFSKQTNGTFDVTVGPVVQLWRRALRRNYFPDSAQIREAKQAVGYKKVRLNAKNRTVLLTQKGMRLDFGAIGKGYAADEALRVLRSFNITSAFLDAGGDLAIGDAPPQKAGWEIEVSSGGKDSTAKKVVTLKNCGVATSGDTYRFLEHNGIRYSHIVDPRTGIGLITHTRTTVIATNGTAADALATAFSVLGIGEGKQVAKKMKNIRIWLLEQNGPEWKKGNF